jgi:hypothetical protein
VRMPKMEERRGLRRVIPVVAADAGTEGGER